LTKVKNKGQRKRIWTLPYHLMLLPGILFLLVYHIAPMFGSVIAFQDFVPAKGFFGSKWVGLENFKFMFQLPDTWSILSNTLIIAVSKIIFNLIFAVLFAVLLNELRHLWLKKTIQTIAYLPHFLSWVILATIFRDILDPSGLVNTVLMNLHLIGEPIFFLGDNSWFQGVIVATDVWKEFGYNAVMFIAALAGVNPELYEAAAMDGAGRLRRIWHITLTSIRPTIVLVATLNIANIFNAGFDQIFNLYSPVVYATGDVIDTYVYRAGFVSAQYSLATAVGLMKSVVSFILIIVSYKLADRFAGYRIF
jgi:putative aldouronate transport system permease protein